MPRLSLGSLPDLHDHGTLEVVAQPDGVSLTYGERTGHTIKAEAPDSLRIKGQKGIFLCPEEGGRGEGVKEAEAGKTEEKATAGDLSYQNCRSITMPRPRLGAGQGWEGVKEPHFGKSDRKFPLPSSIARRFEGLRFRCAWCEHDPARRQDRGGGRDCRELFPGLRREPTPGKAERGS